MKSSVMAFLVLSLAMSCKGQVNDSDGSYWIPDSIDWEVVRGDELANFSTIFFKDDSTMYVLSGYQRREHSSDSIAFGVEPSFNIKKGEYHIKSNSMKIEIVANLLYGAYVKPDSLSRAKVEIILTGKNETIVKYNGIKFSETRLYSTSSKGLMNSYISIAEKNNKRVKIISVEDDR